MQNFEIFRSKCNSTTLIRCFHPVELEFIFILLLFLDVSESVKHTDVEKLDFPLRFPFSFLLLQLCSITNSFLNAAANVTVFAAVPAFNCSSRLYLCSQHHVQPVLKQVLNGTYNEK